MPLQALRQLRGSENTPPASPRYGAFPSAPSTRAFGRADAPAPLQPTQRPTTPKPANRLEAQLDLLLSKTPTPRRAKSIDQKMSENRPPVNKRPAAPPSPPPEPTPVDQSQSARVHSPGFYQALKMRWRPAGAVLSPSTPKPTRAASRQALGQVPADAFETETPTPTMPVPVRQRSTESTTVNSDLCDTITALHGLPSPPGSPTDSIIFRRASERDSSGGGMAGIGAGAAAMRAMMREGHFWEYYNQQDTSTPRADAALAAAASVLNAARPTLGALDTNFAASGPPPPESAASSRDSLAYLLPSALDDESNERPFPGLQSALGDVTPPAGDRLSVPGEPRLSSAWSTSPDTSYRSRSTSDAATTESSDQQSLSEATRVEAVRIDKSLLVTPTTATGSITPELAQEWDRQMAEVERRWSGALKRSSVRASGGRKIRASVDVAQLAQKAPSFRTSAGSRTSLPATRPRSEPAGSHSSPAVSTPGSDALSAAWDSFVSAADVSISEDDHGSREESLADLASIARTAVEADTKENDAVEALLMMKAPISPPGAKKRPSLVGLGIDDPSLASFDAFSPIRMESGAVLPDLPRSRGSKHLSGPPPRPPRPDEAAATSPLATADSLSSLVGSSSIDFTLVSSFPTPPRSTGSASVSPEASGKAVGVMNRTRAHFRSKKRRNGSTASTSSASSTSSQVSAAAQASTGPAAAPPSFSDRMGKESSRAAAPAPLHLTLPDRTPQSNAPLTPPPSVPLPPKPLWGVDADKRASGASSTSSGPLSAPALPSPQIVRQRSADVVQRPARLASLQHNRAVKQASPLPPVPVPERQLPAPPATHTEGWVAPATFASPVTDARTPSTISSATFSPATASTPASSIFDDLDFSSTPLEATFASKGWTTADDDIECVYGMAV